MSLNIKRHTRRVADIPEKAGNSSVHNLVDADHTESVALPNFLQSRDIATDEIDAAPLKATARKSENPFPTIPPDVSAVL